jgi:hypothetical protein
MAVDTLKVKGTEKPVTEFDERTLKWFANECKNRKSASIAQRELARRAGGAPAPRATQSQAIMRQPESGNSLAIEGNFRDPALATAALKKAAGAYHLIAPSTVVGALQEGCAVALALVRIDPDDPNLYRVGDKLALDRTHLAQLANAVGASVVESRRTDDGSDPHYCAWTVTVRFRQFDGSWAYRSGSAEQDLREPYGAEYVDHVEKAKDKGRDPRKQIREHCRFITRHAESKALNRAYAAIGLRRSYTKVELERPFCVARVMFTGQSDDPEARAQFREGVMRNYLSSSDDAYGRAGAPAAASHQLAPPPPMPDYSQPPTIDTEGEEEDDEPPDFEPQQSGTAQPTTTTQPGLPGVGPEKF